MKSIQLINNAGEVREYKVRVLSAKVRAELMEISAKHSQKVQRELTTNTDDWINKVPVQDQMMIRSLFVRVGAKDADPTEVAQYSIEAMSTLARYVEDAFRDELTIEICKAVTIVEDKDIDFTEQDLGQLRELEAFFRP